MSSSERMHRDKQVGIRGSYAARYLLCCAWIALCFFGRSSGDTIQLFDDSILQGQIRSFESGAFRLVDASGKEFRIALRDCQEWSIGTPSQITDKLRPSLWQIRLRSEGVIHGNIAAIGNSRLTVNLKNSLLPELEIPIRQVLSCVRVAARVPHRVNESSADVVVTQVAPNRSIEVTGRIGRLEKDRLLFVFKGKERSIRFEKINAIFPAHEPSPHRELFFHAEFSDSIRLPVLFESMKDGHFFFKTLWGSRIEIPEDGFGVFSARNGRFEFLSHLDPVEVIETPFFDRTMTWRKDQALDGQPLVLNHTTYAKGISTHSHCELAYALNGAFSRLFVTVGIDDRKRHLGDVDIAVYADQTELYRNPRLNKSNSPIELDLPLAGIGQLRLITRFGVGQDVGDEVIWANARLLRK